MFSPLVDTLKDSQMPGPCRYFSDLGGRCFCLHLKVWRCPGSWLATEPPGRSSFIHIFFLMGTSKGHFRSVYHYNFFKTSVTFQAVNKCVYMLIRDVGLKCVS